MRHVLEAGFERNVDQRLFGGCNQTHRRVEAKFQIYRNPRGAELVPIPGSPTNVLPWAEGCAFAPRCANRVDRCTDGPPALLVDEPRALRCRNPLPGGEELS